jgi:hypothetical protein
MGAQNGTVSIWWNKILRILNKTGKKTRYLPQHTDGEPFLDKADAFRSL